MMSEHVNPPRHFEPPGIPWRLRLGVIGPTPLADAHAVKMTGAVQQAINRNDTPVTFWSWVSSQSSFASLGDGEQDEIRQRTEHCGIDHLRHSLPGHARMRQEFSGNCFDRGPILVNQLFSLR